MGLYQKSTNLLLATVASILICLGILVPRPAHAGSAEDAYAQAQNAFRELQSMPEEKRKFRHHWQAVIDKFKAVAEKYPKSSVADDALYTEGELYFRLYDVSRLKSDLSSAVDAWKTCEAKYPASNYADDSLYWEATALDLLGRHDQAVAALHELLEKHPKGDMVRDAKRLLAKLDPGGETHTSVASATATPAPTPTAVAVAATPEPTPTPAAKATPAPVATGTPTSPSVLSGGEAGESQQVHKVKAISNEGYTRVVIYAGGSVHWNAHQIKADGDKPPRIYVDLTKARVGDDLKKDAPKLDNAWEIPIEDGLLKRARVAQYDQDTVRVVLDLASIGRWEIVPFDDPFRLVLDFYGVNAPSTTVAVAPTPAANATPAPTSSPNAAATPEPIVSLTPEEAAARAAKTGISLTAQLGLKFTRIYVDAGHGGHDPGAIGPTGVREKDVNLAIAQKLQKKLVELGYDAILTRKDDTFLELEERTGIANAGHGDLFISVHCNSTDKKGDRNASGIEVYYADLPSDRAAARLSAIENATSERHMSDLEKVLNSLLRSDFTKLSGELAIDVEKRLVTDVRKVNPALKSHGTGVKSALFYVCLTAQMPAVLVETSFISNPKEEKKLAYPKYQDVLADGIAGAVDDYLNDKAAKARHPDGAIVEASVKTDGAADPKPLATPSQHTAKKRRAERRH